MPIPWLDVNEPFPSVDKALSDPNGLLAAGADLSPKRLVDAYSKGIFPWFNEGEPILWWSPSPRLVLKPSQFHASRSFLKQLNKKNWQVVINRNFDSVIDGCQLPRNYTSETWICARMKAAYGQLHAQGLAHSVEVYENDHLIGGLYGIAMFPLFFGESMFSTESNASKLALYALCTHLLKHQFKLIDCQVKNQHLVSLGAQEIERCDFQKYLDLISDSQESEVWTIQEIEY